MGLFSRLGRRRAPDTGSRGERAAQLEEARQHVEQFVRTRIGVEAFLEPATSFIPPTVILVASTGEWTRRRIPDPALVHELSERLAVPVYDVRLVGYPQRMRDWNSRTQRGSTPPD